MTLRLICDKCGGVLDLIPDATEVDEERMEAVLYWHCFHCKRDFSGHFDMPSYRQVLPCTGQDDGE
jgi:hypothetical protein